MKTQVGKTLKGYQKKKKKPEMEWNVKGKEENPEKENLSTSWSKNIKVEVKNGQFEQNIKDQNHQINQTQKKERRYTSKVKSRADWKMSRVSDRNKREEGEGGKPQRVAFVIF